MLRLGRDREIRRGGEPGGLCESGAEPARPRHHGGLRPAQERKRQAARQRRAHNANLAAPRKGERRFKAVIAPEQFVADGEGWRAEQAARGSLLGLTLQGVLVVRGAGCGKGGIGVDAEPREYRAQRRVVADVLLLGEIRREDGAGERRGPASQRTDNASRAALSPFCGKRTGGRVS